ncbi:hypothetical protein SLS57_011808 [Botryosphaeria dothidea]
MANGTTDQRSQKRHALQAGMLGMSPEAFKDLKQALRDDIQDTFDVFIMLDKRGSGFDDLIVTTVGTIKVEFKEHFSPHTDFSSEEIKGLLWNIFQVEYSFVNSQKNGQLSNGEQPAPISGDSPTQQPTQATPTNGLVQQPTQATLTNGSQQTQSGTPENTPVQPAHPQIPANDPTPQEIQPPSGRRNLFSRPLGRFVWPRASSSSVPRKRTIPLHLTVNGGINKTFNVEDCETSHTLFRKLSDDGRLALREGETVVSVMLPSHPDHQEVPRVLHRDNEDNFDSLRNAYHNYFVVKSVQQMTVNADVGMRRIR